MPSSRELRERMAAVLQQYLALDEELRRAESHHFRVCVFGSARIRQGDPVYAMVHDLAKELGMLGADVVTGGGPGLMEAANSGLQDAHSQKVRSYGLPLAVPTIGEPANKHLDIKSMHSRFSLRLDEFMRLSHAVVVAPGGIGTLLELFYVWQLLQLSMIEKRVVLMLSRRYWDGLLSWMHDQVLAHGLIGAKDLDLVRVVDTIEEAIAILGPEIQAFQQARNRRAAAQPAAARAVADATKAAASGGTEDEVREALQRAERALRSMQNDDPPPAK
jgi:uncharacterized protein (TIGR00730 family)